MKTKLVDFYWKKEVWFDPTQSAFHVTVADVAETMDDVATLEGVASRQRVIPVAQAVKEGFDLSAIGVAINSATTDAQKTIIDQQSQIAELQATLDAVQPDVQPSLWQRAKSLVGLGG